MRVLRYAPWLVVPLIIVACESSDRAPSATAPTTPIATQVASAPQPGQPLFGLTASELTLFHLGKSVFDSIFTPQTGLGPVFNANGCATCHLNGGTGTQVEIQGTRYANGMCDELDSVGGFVFELFSTPQLIAALGINGEPIPRYAQTGHRTTPQLFGRGLLEAITDSAIKAQATLEARQDPPAAGRVAVLSDGTIGRFGRKDQGSTLLDFNTDAFLYEIGITTPGSDDSTEKPMGDQPMPPGVALGPEPNLSLAKLNQTTDFVRYLAPPAPSGPDNEYQDATFQRIGCATCHVPAMQTGANAVPALNHRTVHAYTDLLLHDMGPALADICLGAAKPSEFRTEPLMGLHLRTTFLHDGRATTINEAILAHGGQASGARQRFAALPEPERSALIRYLQTF
jgi:CxxC motif-containing protein (DUF1111 family)